MNHPDPSESRPPFGALASDPEIRRLVSNYFDGTATEEQVRALSREIQDSQEVRDFFIAHAALVSQLSVYSTAPADDTDPLEGAVSLALRPQNQSASWSVSSTVIGIAAAFVILFGSFTWWTFYSTPERYTVSQVVGEFRIDSGESNSEGGSATAAQPLLLGQTISLDEGECNVRLLNGVELLVTSPAQFAIEDSMRCRLWRGRLTADVPQQAIGFRVVTQHADIVDQGTRFGVAVEPESGTDIAVFEGRVDVASHGQPLKVGRAVSINAEGQLSRLQMVTPETFESSRNSSNPSHAIIESVRDNIRSLQELGFYRIAPGGFGEDQPAYVDRVHQWNGIDTSGLPQELIGGDYVMPFNDDKLNEDFSITLSLAREAHVYVLFDDRNSTPEWLKVNYIDTGKDVGQDEGNVPGNKTMMETASGAGQSIDNQFSVWKSRTPLSGEVTMQGLWMSTEEQSQIDSLQNLRSMYGIVAVPTDAEINATENSERK